MLVLLIFAVVYLGFTHFLQRFRPSSTLFKLPGSSQVTGIALSLFAGRFSLPYLLLVSSMLLSQGEVGLWFMLSSSLGAGLFLFIFIPLWNQMPFENENDFTLMRFPDVWGHRLFRFRGYYVGIIVNACLVSLSFVAFMDIMEVVLNIKKQHALIFLLCFTCLNVYRNTLANKLYSDGFNLVLLGFIFLLGLVISGGRAAPIQALPDSIMATFGSIPYRNHPLFLHFLSYSGLMWWSAQLFDGSGTFAQRIMGMNRRKAQWAYVMDLLLELVGLLFIIYFSLQAFAALGEEYSSDQVLFAWLAQGLGYELGRSIAGLLVFILLITATENSLNWAGSLVDSTQTTNRPKWQRYGYMLMVALLAFVFVWFFESIANIIYFFLGISAGTSIIFILRWFTARINAQVQLSAMIGAVVFSFAASILVRYIGIAPEDEFIFSLAFVSLMNLTLCFLVSLLSYSEQNKKDYEDFKRQLQWPTTSSWLKAIGLGLLVVIVQYGLYRGLILGF